VAGGEDCACPERITHRGKKFNNVLLDDATAKASVSLNWAPVLRGLALYDFGWAPPTRRA